MNKSKIHNPRVSIFWSELKNLKQQQFTCIISGKCVKSCAWVRLMVKGYMYKGCIKNVFMLIKGHWRLVNVND